MIIFKVAFSVPLEDETIRVIIERAKPLMSSADFAQYDVLGCLSAVGGIIDSESDIKLLEDLYYNQDIRYVEFQLPN